MCLCLLNDNYYDDMGCAIIHNRDKEAISGIFATEKILV